MSAVPGVFMRDPPKPEETDADPPADDGESGGNFWQWLAIGVLLGCWLAEATWCMERGC